MRRVYAPALVGLALGASVSRGQDRFVPSVVPAGGDHRFSRPVALPCPPPGVAPYIPGVPGVPPGPGGPQMDTPVPPPGVTEVPQPLPAFPQPDPAAPLSRRLADPFAQGTEAGGVAPRSFNENFDGDFGGAYYRRLITTYSTVPRVTGFTQRVTGFTPTTTSSTTQTTTIDTQGRVVITNTVTNNTTNTPIIANDPIIASDRVAATRIARLTLASRYSGVLVTDNDNPRPQDRVYGGFNFYDDIGGKLNPGLGQVDLQRQMFGFEKNVPGRGTRRSGCGCRSSSSTGPRAWAAPRAWGTCRCS